MINLEKFFNLFKQLKIEFFCGIPDSLLKDFCAYISDNVTNENHIITSNEGNAIALATGYNLATGKIALVYMQNSGLGNSVNPLVSITDKEVYSVPMLLLIGWRGEPSNKDEPQHVKQGEITLKLLNVLDIECEVLSDDFEKAACQVKNAVKYMQTNSVPFAFVVRKSTFEKYKHQKKTQNKFELSREKAIQIIASSAEKDAVFVTTTGKASRELYEYREANNELHNADFLTVGSMGHCSSIALGLSIQTDRRVYCIDGDGAAIMHLGALTSIGQIARNNFLHIIINNGTHESVGGQPTVGFNIDFCSIAKACGYKNTFSVSNEVELKERLQEISMLSGPSLIEIKVNNISRENLGRPRTSPMENKNEFIKFFRQ